MNSDIPDEIHSQNTSILESIHDDDAYDGEVFQDTQSLWTNGPKGLAANRLWLTETLYMNDSLCVRLLDSKTSYVYSAESRSSSFVFSSDGKSALDSIYEPTQLMVRMSSEQTLLLLMELENMFHTEILVKDYSNESDSEFAYAFCHKNGVDEWIVNLDLARHISTTVISTIIYIQLEKGFSVDIYLPRTSIFKIQAYIKNSCPDLQNTRTSTTNGHIICLHHNGHNVSIAATQVLELINANYHILSYPIAPRELPILPASKFSLSNITKKVQKEQLPLPADFSRKVLQLKKHEVSFLMGYQGSRIEYIRKTSGCAIKTLPFETTSTSLIPLKNTPQGIIVCGTHPNVDYGIKLIQQYIAGYKEKNNYR